MRELTQTFRFPGVSAERLANLLATAPIVGEGSIFGERKVASTDTVDGVRRASGFEPAPIPLLRFDVELRQERLESETRVWIEFSQPDRKRPYIAGQFIWLLSDDIDGAAVLREEINTREALSVVSRPLDGPRPSFRRWLFFAGGHQRLMKDVEGNLRALLSA